MNNAHFSYNPANQIVERSVSNNNFQIAIPTLSTQTYAVNNLNQYTSVQGQTVNHDSNGNLTNYNGWVYGYNAHNRLVSADKADTELVLSYDAIGRLERSTLHG
ncbi:hypothetical protein [Thalassotalea piscium]|uniref:hypothetical protein n=1 Tax=Thalassotalea piscium TaxID=1230533 RepID=UPI002574076B|nr:hypothetical protein [Thalassotalea piscium]